MEPRTFCMQWIHSGTRTPSQELLTFKPLSHGNFLQQPQDSDKICISRSVSWANTTAPGRGQQPHRGLDWCHNTRAPHCLEEKPWLPQSSGWNVMKCPLEEPFPTLPHPLGSALNSLAYLLFWSFIYRKLLSLFWESGHLTKYRAVQEVYTTSFILKTRIWEWGVRKLQDPPAQQVWGLLPTIRFW